MLQAGFYLECLEGKTLLNLLLNLPGFDESYLANRVQTIFYNGDAIDDLEIPITGTNATVALSAALPGLAGAIMRKGSPHAALRKTPRVQGAAGKNRLVKVRIKLFNAITVERGPALFKHGVNIMTKDFISFFTLRPNLLLSFKNLMIDKIPVPGNKLLETLNPYDLITVKTLP